MFLVLDERKVLLLMFLEKRKKKKKKKVERIDLVRQHKTSLRERERGKSFLMDKRRNTRVPKFSTIIKIVA